MSRFLLILGYALLAVALVAVVASIVWSAEWGVFLLLALACAGLAAILLLEYHRRAGAARTP